MKIYETRSALKTFYFLLAIDGSIDQEELTYFHTIGLNIDPGNFVEYSDALERECSFVINCSSDKYYDLISAAVDEALTHEAEDDDQGLTPRLIVWNLLAAAFANGVYDDAEKQLINHIARKVMVDESIILEMEQMMKTSASIQNEINWANRLSRPDEEIRQLVDELKKRQTVIMESAEYLIADEIDADNPYEYKPDFFDKTKSKVDEKVKPVTDKVGKKIKPVTDKVGTAVAPVAKVVGDGAKKTAEVASQKITPVAIKAKEKTGEMFGKLSKRFGRGKNSNDNKEGK